MRSVCTVIGGSAWFFMMGLILQIGAVPVLHSTAQATTISSLTATPSLFAEGSAATVTLSALIDGDVASFAWSQTKGPKVPLTALSATAASADVAMLAVAVDTELGFRLTVMAADGSTVTQDVSVFVQPVDLLPFLGVSIRSAGPRQRSARSFTAARRGRSSTSEAG
jgi:hypothetical protein